MIHRALLGSMERFAGILIEHYAGRFPDWLAPVQAILLPVSDRQNEYATEVAEGPRERGVRASVDHRPRNHGIVAGVQSDHAVGNFLLVEFDHTSSLS